ncbi:sensor histidine kinase [Dyadobacter sp. CY312]|uniref:sensor histidine kinase n=1 Tax=Dyadobacter sp. CY312 TaxID=2907303 RepID=UPI001F2AE71B|nr:histidine kinase [Dyadobacter sp. CY312]MCE7042760.1 histidine kinase [Dyadobacter sp. CY312]
MSSIIIFIFLLSIIEDLGNAINRFFETFLFFSATSFTNLLLLKIFQGNKKSIGKRLPANFYVLSFTASIIIGILTRLLYSLFTKISWESEGFDDLWDYAPSLVAVTALNSLILIVQKFVIIQHERVQGEIENLQLKASASETKNLLLIQQIHPHFLFNSLTTIKSLYKVDVKQGESYLIHLANFLRVAISSHNTTTALLKDELEFCLDYLKMQEVRFGSALSFSVSVDQQTANTRYLPYFSLQPLVENVLKHNDLTEDRPIHIKIEQLDNYLTISNNMQPRRYKEPSTGYGLSNLSERYVFMGSEDIRITSNNEYFTVTIRILAK